jgi:hypothetical protein
MTNVLSQASPSFQAQQQQQQQYHHLNRSRPPLERSSTTLCDAKHIQPPLEKQHVIASTERFLISEFVLTENVKFKLYPPIGPLG